MGCLQLSYYEDLSGFTGVSRMKVVYVNPRLKAKKESDFSGVDYYPFGEKMPGRYGSSNPASGEGMFGYQGQEKVGHGSKWYNFQLRMYNPSIGRWSTIDPYSQHYSPYLAMSNNPISYIDPDGGRDNPYWLRDAWRKLWGKQPLYGKRDNDDPPSDGDFQPWDDIFASIYGGSTSGGSGPSGGSPGSSSGPPGGGSGPFSGSPNSGNGNPSSGFSGVHTPSINELSDRMDNPQLRNDLWQKDPNLAKILINKKNGESKAASKKYMFAKAARVARSISNRVFPTEYKFISDPTAGRALGNIGDDGSHILDGLLGSLGDNVPDINAGGPLLASLNGGGVTPNVPSNEVMFNIHLNNVDLEGVQGVNWATGEVVQYPFNIMFKTVGSSATRDKTGDKSKSRLTINAVARFEPEGKYILSGDKEYELDRVYFAVPGLGLDGRTPVYYYGSYPRQPKGGLNIDTKSSVQWVFDYFRFE